MKKIPLSQGKYAVVDDEDYEWLNKWKWHYLNGYAQRWSSYVNGKREAIRMHRVVNVTPVGMHTDHINGNKSDNRKANLRSASPSENQYNSFVDSSNSSGYKGVSFHKGTQKWGAKISYRGKGFWLGVFESLEDAAETYDVAAYHLHGEFAKMNFAGV